MSYLMQLKESLFSRVSSKPADNAASLGERPETVATREAITAQDADAGDAYLDEFADGVEWETLLVDLACFNDGPEYSAQARF